MKTSTLKMKEMEKIKRIKGKLKINCIEYFSQSHEYNHFSNDFLNENKIYNIEEIKTKDSSGDLSNQISYQVEKIIEFDKQTKFSKFYCEWSGNDITSNSHYKYSELTTKLQNFEINLWNENK